MITPASLKSYRLKDLAQLARKRGVTGWHSMNKEQLIRSLTGAASGGKRVGSAARAPAEPKPRASKSSSRPAKGVARDARLSPAAKPVAKPASAVKKDSRAKTPTKPKNPRVLQKIQREHAKRERLRDMATPALSRPTSQDGKDAPTHAPEAQRDRIVLLVRDPYWLHACWEITRQSVQRAQAAMAEHWHTAAPVLRVLEVENTGTTSSAERMYREIPIHGGVQNWYIDVQDPPKSFRVDLGYRASNGKFYAMVKSNSVTTPKPGSAEVDENWSDVAENAEKIFAQSGGYAEENNSFELQELFEERLQRPMGSPLMSRFGTGADRMVPRRRDFQFEVDAEMIVFGSTKADAHVTLSGEPVKLRPDGSFTVRLAMPDKRQVIPIVAASRDGLEQRTVVIAIERNTKVMEPMIRESSE